MISLFMFILIVALICLPGYLLVNYFWNESLNNYEKAGLSFMAGLTLNYCFNLFASIVGIGINFLSIITPLIVMSILLLWLNIKYKKLNLKPKPKKIGRSDFINSFLLFAFISLFFFTIFYQTLSSGFNSWDEYSFWGKATKSINFTQDFFMMDALSAEGDSNPTLVPVSAHALASWKSDFFAENYAKMLSPLSLLFFTIFLYGYMKRLGIGLMDRSIFLILFLFSSQKLTQLSTILYADIFFLYVYSIGVACLLRVLYEKLSLNTIYLSVAILALLPFIKRGGSVSAIIAIFSVFVFLVPMIIKQKKQKVLIMAPVLIVLAQLASSFITKIGGEVYSPFPPEPFQYIRQAIPMIPGLIAVMLKKLTDLNYHTIIFPISVFAMLAAAFVGNKKVYLAVIIIGILNIGYFFAGGLMLFSLEELVTLASFERYIVQFLPIYFMGLIFAYSELRQYFFKKVGVVRRG
jgi:hypothetical protein